MWQALVKSVNDAYVNNLLALSTCWPAIMFLLNINRILGVMVIVLASSAEIMGSNPNRVKPNTMKLVFVVSPLSTKH
jgi:hypothetical protein